MKRPAPYAPRHLLRRYGVFLALDATTLSWNLTYRMAAVGNGPSLASGPLPSTAASLAGVWTTLRLVVNGTTADGWVGGAQVRPPRTSALR
jgi:hypothetical protein